jgi:hypothetical protein
VGQFDLSVKLPQSGLGLFRHNEITSGLPVSPMHVGALDDKIIWRLLRFAPWHQSQRFSQERVGNEKACESKANKYRSNKRQTVQWNCPATLSDLAQESASADHGSRERGNAPPLPGR